MIGCVRFNSQNHIKPSMHFAAKHNDITSFDCFKKNAHNDISFKAKHQYSINLLRNGEPIKASCVKLEAKDFNAITEMCDSWSKTPHVSEPDDIISQFKFWLDYYFNKKELGPNNPNFYAIVDETKNAPLKDKIITIFFTVESSPIRCHFSKDRVKHIESLQTKPEYTGDVENFKRTHFVDYVETPDLVKGGGELALYSMIRDILEKAENQHLTAIDLVAACNSSPFYEKMGFQRIDDSKCYKLPRELFEGFMQRVEKKYGFSRD